MPNTHKETSTHQPSERDDHPIVAESAGFIAPLYTNDDMKLEVTSSTTAMSNTDKFNAMLERVNKLMRHHHKQSDEI